MISPIEHERLMKEDISYVKQVFRVTLEHREAMCRKQHGISNTDCRQS